MSSEIDLVYLWVNGNDPKWIQKRDSFLNIDVKKTSLIGRYEDNNELKYSLRSVDKHLPWIRKIFIITDNQIPDFLNVNHPKIEIIDHTEIMPKEILPTFNSWVIDCHIHNIPNLSEKFIYANDDCFINEDLTPDFFFKNNLPIIRMKSSIGFFFELKFKKLINIFLNTYDLGTLKASKIVKNKYNKYYFLRKHHNIDSYLKSDYQKATENFYNEVKETLLNRFRKDNDLQRILFDLDILANNRGCLKYIKDNESIIISVQEPDYKSILKNYKPKLFCLNDNEKTTNEDKKRIKPFLETLFPNKSQFEK